MATPGLIFLSCEVSASSDAGSVCVNVSSFCHGVCNPWLCWTRQAIMMPFDKGSVVTMRRQGRCLISQGYLMWQSSFSRGFELLKDKDCVMGVDTFQGLVLPLSIMLDTFEQLDNVSVHTSCCSYCCFGLGQTHLARATSSIPGTHTILPFTFCFRHSLLRGHVVDPPVGTH